MGNQESKSHINRETPPVENNRDKGDIRRETIKEVAGKTLEKIRQSASGAFDFFRKTKKELDDNLIADGVNLPEGLKPEVEAAMTEIYRVDNLVATEQRAAELAVQQVEANAEVAQPIVSAASEILVGETAQLPVVPESPVIPEIKDIPSEQSSATEVKSQVVVEKKEPIGIDFPVVENINQPESVDLSKAEPTIKEIADDRKADVLPKSETTDKNKVADLIKELSRADFGPQVQLSWGEQEINLGSEEDPKLEKVAKASLDEGSKAKILEFLLDKGIDKTEAENISQYMIEQLEDRFTKTIQAQTQLEVSKMWKYHKKTMLVYGGIGVGCTLGINALRVWSGVGTALSGISVGAIKIAASTTLGGILGAVRLSVVNAAKYLQPKLERLAKDKDTASAWDRASKNKAGEILNQESIDIVARQILREKLTEDFKAEVDPKADLMTMVELLTQQHPEISQENIHILAKQMVALNQLSATTEKRAFDHMKDIDGKPRMSRSKKDEYIRSTSISAGYGAIMPASTEAATLMEVGASGAMWFSSLAGGAMGAKIFGESIDKWLSRVRVEKSYKGFGEQTKKSGLGVSAEEVDNVQALLDGGFLNYDPILQSQAKNFLMEAAAYGVLANQEQVRSAQKKIDKDISRQATIDKNVARGVGGAIGFSSGIFGTYFGRLLNEHIALHSQKTGSPTMVEVSGNKQPASVVSDTTKVPAESIIRPAGTKDTLYTSQQLDSALVKNPYTVAVDDSGHIIPKEELVAGMGNELPWAKQFGGKVTLIENANVPKMPAGVPEVHMYSIDKDGDGIPDQYVLADKNTVHNIWESGDKDAPVVELSQANKSVAAADTVPTDTQKASVPVIENKTDKGVDINEAVADKKSTPAVSELIFGQKKSGQAVEFTVGQGKDVHYLDQGLRRVVADLYKPEGQAFTATDAAKIENTLANVRELAQGHDVAGIKAADWKGVVSWDGKSFKVLDQTAFENKVNGLFGHSQEVVTPKSDAYAYVKANQAVYQEKFGGKMAVEDFSKNELVQGAESRVAAAVRAAAETIPSGSKSSDYVWAQGKHYSSITEAVSSLAPQFEGSKNLHLYAADINGDKVPDEYILGDHDDAVEVYTKGANEDMESFVLRATEGHKELAAEIQAIDKTLGKTAADFSVIDKGHLATSLQLEQKGGSLVPESQKTLQGVVDKLGDDAGKYLHDHDLGSYVKDNLNSLGKEEIHKLFQEGSKLHQAGWKSVDYGMVKSLLESGRTTDGNIYDTNLKSPLTNETIKVNFDNKGSFTKEVVGDAYSKALNLRTQELAEINKLCLMFESKAGSGLPAMTLPDGTIDKALKMDAGAPLEAWRQEFGGRGYKDATVTNLYNELNRLTGGKLGSGSGTVAENMEKAFVNKTVLPEKISSELSPMANLDTTAAKTAPVKPESIEVNTGKSQSATPIETPVKSPDFNIKKPVDLPEPPRPPEPVKSAGVAESVAGAKAKSSPEVIKEVQDEIKVSKERAGRWVGGVKEQADDVFGEMDRDDKGFEALYNPKLTAAEKLAAIQDMKLTDGGRPYVYNNSAAIYLKDGKYYFQTGSSAVELNESNLNKLNQALTGGEKVPEPPKPPVPGK